MNRARWSFYYLFVNCWEKAITEDLSMDCDTEVVNSEEKLYTETANLGVLERITFYHAFSLLSTTFYKSMELPGTFLWRIKKLSLNQTAIKECNQRILKLDCCFLIVSIFLMYDLYRSQLYYFAWTRLLMVCFTCCSALTLSSLCLFTTLFVHLRAFIFWRTSESRGLLIGLD